MNKASYEAERVKMTQTLTAQQTQQEKVQGLIKEFSVDKDIIQAVTDIESRYATTQNHYGDYMSFLSPYQAKICLI